MSDNIVKPVVNTTNVSPAPQVNISIDKESSALVEAKQEAKDLAPDLNDSDTAGNLVPEGDWRTSPLFYEVSQFLGVDTKNYEQDADKIGLIVDWAINNTGSNKIEDIFTAIRSLEDELQPPAWGETRYNNLFKYLRLESKASPFIKALNAFKKNKETK